MGIPPEIESMLKRPGLFVQLVNYDTICSFLSGYDSATKGGLLVGFHEWLVIKRGHGNNLHWTALAECLAFPNAEDPSAERRVAEPQVMIDFLFNLIREYFVDLDSPQGLRGIYLRYDHWLRKQQWFGPGSPDWMPLDR
jgi:hypothetical protein